MLKIIENFQFKWKVFSAPLNQVTFADFWLADQLTSLEFLFTDMQFFVCWFLFQAQWAPFKSNFEIFFVFLKLLNKFLNTICYDDWESSFNLKENVP